MSDFLAFFQKFFDQIAFTSRPKKTRLVQSGSIDWRGSIYRPEDKDHYEPIAIAARDFEAQPSVPVVFAARIFFWRTGRRRRLFWTGPPLVLGVVVLARHETSSAAARTRGCPRGR